MLFIPHVDFYITNVCNLTCRGCNRFNNLGLKGFQRWSDHATEIEHWAKRLTFNKITIIGGEPTLNPDLEKWCINLRRLWSNTEILIQSNGTYKTSSLDFFQEYNIGFAVSVHDEEMVSNIKKNWSQDTFLIGATVFHQNALVDHKDFWGVHTSNPKIAFEACSMKYDITFFNGKLYKCPVTALLPEVYKQKDLRLNKRQLELMMRYTPLTPSCTDEELQTFISQRDTPIANCEFCPSKLKWHTALGELKENLPKPKFERYNEKTSSKKDS
jgi:organic radical activating enzyme